MGQKIFPLDSVTEAFLPMLQCAETDSGTYLYAINRSDNSLRVFDYAQEKELSPIRYEREGEHGVGKIAGFLVHTRDSIFLYNNHSVLLTSDQGLVNQRVLIEITGTNAFVLTSTICPMVWRDDRLYLLATRYSHGYPPFVAVSLADKKTEEVPGFLVSPAYAQGCWGGMNYDTFYASYDPGTARWVISFPNDKNLYITDLKGDNISFPAYSQFFDTVPPPYQTQAEAAADPQYTERFFMNPSFYFVKHDPYTGYTFRSALQGVSKELLPLPSMFDIPMTLVILNKQHQRVGEYKLPKGVYYPVVHFITKEGLHMARRDTENEDQLVFDVFQLSDL
ncbi:MAG: DUF4221 family protein [Bernardetiaceae bacterium]